MTKPWIVKPHEENPAENPAEEYRVITAGLTPPEGVTETVQDEQLHRLIQIFRDSLEQARHTRGYSHVNVEAYFYALKHLEIITRDRPHERIKHRALLDLYRDLQKALYLLADI